MEHATDEGRTATGEGRTATVAREGRLKGDRDGEQSRGPAGALAVGDERSQMEPRALVTEDLLVEDVSIDGMCGVY